MGTKIQSIVMGVFVAILGLIGLIMSARATDDFSHYGGLAIFGFAVLFIFARIGAAFPNRRD